MKPTRVELLDDNDEWQPVHGITNIVIYDEPEVARMTAERMREAQEAVNAFMRAFVEAVRPAVEQAAATLAEISRAAQAAGLLDEQGKPVERSDRPAWQSPYGPPTRRH